MLFKKIFFLKEFCFFFFFKKRPLKNQKTFFFFFLKLYLLKKFWEPLLFFLFSGVFLPGAPPHYWFFGGVGFFSKIKGAFFRDSPVCLFVGPKKFFLRPNFFFFLVLGRGSKVFMGFFPPKNFESAG